jgi:2-haloacid dehalogenase
MMDMISQAAFGASLNAAQSCTLVRPPHGIKAVVFDAYGTLFDVRSVARLAEELFPGRGAALTDTWRTKQLEYSWLVSLMERYEDFWSLTERGLRFACRVLGLPDDDDKRARLMDEYLRLAVFEDVQPAFARLGNLPRTILSNGAPRMLGAVIEHNRLTGALAHVISVDEVRVFKPSPRVYRLAPERLGMPPESIAFVSSNAWDAQGARAFGLWTCWVNRRGAALDELGFAPDAIVSSLTELAALVAG